MREYPYRFHIALDGNGLNGLEGMAGVCQFLFDPADNAHAYKITYYDGVAGGHAVSVNPSATIGFLGNTGQHLLLYDARNSEQFARQSTLRFESNDTSVRGSTHAVWLSDNEFITAIGDYFYRFDVRDLGAGRNWARTGSSCRTRSSAPRRDGTSSMVRWIIRACRMAKRGRSASSTSKPVQRAASSCRPRAGT
jgi:hypothetical protein